MADLFEDNKQQQANMVMTKENAKMARAVISEFLRMREELLGELVNIIDGSEVEDLVTEFKNMVSPPRKQKVVPDNERCTAQTKKGEPCKKRRSQGKKLCATHLAKRDADKTKDTNTKTKGMESVKKAVAARNTAKKTAKKAKNDPEWQPEVVEPAKEEPESDHDEEMDEESGDEDED